MRQPPQKRRGDPRKRAGFLDSERGGFCRPSLCLFALLVKLLSRLSVRVSCWLLGGFTGRCGLDVLRPPVDPRLPHVAVRVGRPLLAVVRYLRALAVCVMRSEGLYPLGELLEGVPDPCPHGRVFRGLPVLPGVGDVMDGAVELPLIPNNVARLPPPILVPLDKELGELRDGGVVELLLLGHLDEHDLGDRLGGAATQRRLVYALDGRFGCQILHHS